MIRIIILLFLIIGREYVYAHATLMYISAKPITCLNHAYEIEITKFSYDGSNVIFGGLEIVYGDGRIEGIPDDEFTISVINNGRIITKYIKYHVFQGPGIYTINARFFNRTADIENMSNSVNTPFYVGTILHIDPYLGCNTTPKLENFPLTRKRGSGYHQDFSFIDNENDSLSFHFSVPLQNRETPVINYVLPYDQDTLNQRKISKLAVDPFNGSLFLNSIHLTGNYTIALQVNEWRKVEGVDYLMSSSTLDYQMEFLESQNNYPMISGLRDSVIVAGNNYVWNISAIDPENDSIWMNNSGDLFHLISSLKEEDINYYPGHVSQKIDFVPKAEHIRSKPYKGIFSVTDKNMEEGSLNNTQSMYIWIASREHQPGPPENFIGQAISKDLINLSWLDLDDELGYIIQRADRHFPQFERLAILPANNTYFNDSSVVENNIYQYRIKAVGTTMSAYRSIEVATPDIITDLKEEKMDDNPVIFPNPSTGSFKVRNISNYNQLEIIDLSGRKVWHVELHTNERNDQEMDFNPGLSKGAYILNVCSPNNTISKKIVIN